MTTQPTETIKDIQWWGDSGEWIAAPGHQDIAAFTAAADERARHDAGLDEDELPSAYDTAEHLWFRPVTREWFDKHMPISRFVTMPGRTAELAQQQRYEDYRDEGLQEPCQAADAGSAPWTVIRTGA